MINKIFLISFLTLKSIIKDRIFFIIFSLSLLFLFIPAFASFSLRQAQEVSITLCLTLNSFILLTLSLFSAIHTMWRDLERRYIYIFLSYPITRLQYLLGRFLGSIFLLFFISFLNLFFSCLVIKFSAQIYKSSLPILWSNIALSFLFSFLKYVFLLSFSFLFVCFSTSFFVPFFLSISIYLIGNASQSIYEYIISDKGRDLSLFLKKIIIFIYYIFPNFSGFDLINYAAYSLKINYYSLFITFFYFLFYVSIILSISCLIFSKRDML